MKKIISIILSVAMLVTLFAGVTAFADGETTEVTADETITAEGLNVELENYCLVSGAVSTDYAQASGQKYIKAGYSGAVPFDEEGIKINVARAGYYDIEAIMGRKTSDHSSYTIALVNKDGITVTSLSNSQTPAVSDLEGYKKPDGCLYVDLYKKSKIGLDKGVYTLKINVNKNTYYRYLMDYVKFTPYDYYDVSSTEKATRIEFESLLTETSSLRKEHNASGNAIVYSDWTSSPGSFYVPFNIEKDGVYDIEYVIGKSTDTASWSAWTAYLDGEKMSAYNDTDVMGKAADLLGYTEKNSSCSLYLYREPNITLTAGEHWIAIDYNRLTDHYTYVLDYIEFIPKDRTVTISATEPTVIESEHFSNVGNGSMRIDAVASGGRFISNGYSSGPNPSTNIKVDVEKAGLYWVEVLQGYATDTNSYGLKYVTMVNDDLDSVGFAHSNNASEDLEETFDTIYTNYHTIPAHSVDAGQMPIKKFRRLIWLPKGGNTIGVNVGAASGLYKYNLDAITFIPVDGIAVNGEDVEVTANWKTAFTGKAYLALYNGEELVNVTSMDVANASEVKLSLKETDTFDKAKIFVWDVANDNTPLTKARVFTK